MEGQIVLAKYLGALSLTVMSLIPIMKFCLDGWSTWQS